MLIFFTFLLFCIDIQLLNFYNNINQVQQGLGGKKKTPPKSASSTKPCKFVFLFYHIKYFKSMNEEITIKGTKDDKFQNNKTW